MTPAFQPDLVTLRSRIAALCCATAHDVELLALVAAPDGALTVTALLHTTPRTCNTAGIIFGGSLYALARVTGAATLLATAPGSLSNPETALVGTVRGGSIAYLRGANNNVCCTLTLRSAAARVIGERLASGRRVRRTLMLTMQDSNGELVANATLTFSLRLGRAQVAEHALELGAALVPSCP